MLNRLEFIGIEKSISIILALSAGLGLFIGLSPESKISPLIILTLPMAVLILGVVGLVVIKRPKECLIALGVYLLMQDLLVSLSKLFSPEISLIVKRFDEIFIATIIVLIVMNRRGTYLRLPIYVPIFGVVIAGFLSSLFSENISYLPAILDLYLMLKVFLLFFIAANLNWNGKDFRIVAAVFISIGIFIFLIGLLDFIVMDWQAKVGMGSNIQYRLGIRSMQSVFPHPGVFGDVMSIMLVYSLGFFAVLRRWKLFLLIAVFASGALLSLRLRPLAGIAGAVFLMLIFFRNKYTLRIIILSGVLAFIVLLLFGGIISGLIDLKLFELSGGTRYLLTSTGIQIAKDNFPFGSGLGSFGGWISRLYYSPTYSEYGLDQVYGLSRQISSGGDFVMDTHWPYVLAEIGVIGFICYLLVFLGVGRLLYWVFRSPVTSKLNKAFSFAVLLVLFQTMINGFVSPVFQTSLGGYYTFFMAGIAYSWFRQDSLAQFNATIDTGEKVEES